MIKKRWMIKEIVITETTSPGHGSDQCVVKAYLVSKLGSGKMVFI